MSAVGRCLFVRASDKFLVGVAMCTRHVRPHLLPYLFMACMLLRMALFLGLKALN